MASVSGRRSAVSGFGRHATETKSEPKTETKPGLPARYPRRVYGHHCRSVAVEVGFEPTDELPHHTLSRRAPSATRRLHRSRAYLSRSLGGERDARRTGRVLTQFAEEAAQQRRALVREHSADYLDRRAEPRIVQHVPDRAGGPRPGVGGPVYQPGHPAS